MKTKIAIIGAGASGLFSAIILSSNGFDVTIFEKNNKIGKKLLATGNGKCNISNKDLSIKYFHTNNKKNRNFIKNILNNFDHNSCKQFFKKIGIEFIYRENGRAYPMSQQASTVVDLLEFEALSNGVNIKLDSEIESIKYSDNKYVLNNNSEFSYLIISTGSIAMPKLGATPCGYNFAKQFGHNIIKPFSSLVQLISDNKNLDIITGVKVDAKVDNVYGDILFTKYGLSGSAILEISRKISAKLQNQNSHKITIDLLPNIASEDLHEILSSNIKKNKNQPLDLWLNIVINKKLAKYIISSVSLPKTIQYANDLNNDNISIIVKTIKHLPFSIVGTKGFDSCEVVAGGVDLDTINENLESTLQKNLYFIGEVVDVDGDCGGYNLQWAWASAYVCAINLLK